MFVAALAYETIDAVDDEDRLIAVDFVILDCSLLEPAQELKAQLIILDLYFLLDVERFLDYEKRCRTLSLTRMLMRNSL